MIITFTTSNGVLYLVALLTDDFIKLKELIIKEIDKFLSDTSSSMATKEELRELKDIVTGIRKKSNTEPSLVITNLKRIPENSIT